MNLPLAWKNIILISILIIGGLFCIHALWSAQKANDSLGFPLDDSWIHLQFARNLHDYGDFSYYKDEMSTAGSTSPLYTLFLALGFFFTSNEMILSYVLGVGFFIIAAFMMYKVSAILFDNHIILVPAAALLLLLDHRLQWIALAGMETTLFIALFLAVLYFYYNKKPIPLGITSGLLLWTRPEAVILFAVITVDIFYEMKFIKRASSKRKQNISPATEFTWLKKGAPYALAVVIAYFALNLYLSGSILPNTYAAKLRYYSTAANNFPLEVFHFLTSGQLLVPSVFAVVSIVATLINVLRRRSASMLVPFLWSLLLFIAYWKNLPRLYQNGRYLMPLLPCLILLSLDGLRIVMELLRGRIRLFAKPRISIIAIVLVVLALAVQFIEKTLREEKTYTDACRYINDRQVKTAMWIRDNLPSSAVVATHDIGAIAFYSGRRVVDMVGLVSPDMIENIGRFDLLMKFLLKHKVTHIATLRNWFEIVNIRPLFQTDPAHPEIMEVFQFDPARTHFTSQDATKLNDAGEYYLSSGNVSYAIQIFRRSIMLDPQSARTNLLMGKASYSLGDLDAAMEWFKIASQLQPDFPGLTEQITDLEKTKSR